METVAKQKLSPHFKKLHGNESQTIYTTYQDIDPFLNQFIQKVLYDKIWTLPSVLTLKQKNLATIVSLITLNKMEFAEIYIRSFLNIGGTAHEINDAMHYLAHKGYIKDLSRTLQLVKNSSKNKTDRDFNDINLPSECALIDVSAHIALGNNEKTKACLQQVAETQKLTLEQIAATMRHIMIYCGCPCTMNGFAIFKLLFPNASIKEKITPPVLSNMMIALYGKTEAEKVYARCDEVDPWFNVYVQNIIYDQLWALKPLTLQQKSITTIVALTVLDKAEQLSIHIKGFLHQGGTPETLLGIFTYLQNQGFIKDTAPVLEILRSLFGKLPNQQKMPEKSDSVMIDLAALTAIDDTLMTKQYLIQLLKSQTLPEAAIRGAMLHVMTYTGYPATANALSIFADAKTEMKHNFSSKL